MSVLDFLAGAQSELADSLGPPLERVCVWLDDCAKKMSIGLRGLP